MFLPIINWPKNINKLKKLYDIVWIITINVFFKNFRESRKTTSYLYDILSRLNSSKFSYRIVPIVLQFYQYFYYSVSQSVSSVTQLCPTFCGLMNCSMPGHPVHHKLLEFSQTHVLRVGDAIQPSHPLPTPSPSAPNPSQHWGLFQWVNSSH